MNNEMGNLQGFSQFPQGFPHETEGIFIELCKPMKIQKVYLDTERIKNTAVLTNIFFIFTQNESKKKIGRFHYDQRGKKTNHRGS